MLLAQSTTKDYVRAENKLQSISWFFIPQVTTSQVSFFFKLQLKSYPQFFGGKKKKKKGKKTTTSDSCFEAYLYSVDIQHGNLHQLSVTMSRVIYLIPRAHTGTGVSHSQYRKKSGEVLEKKAGEWTGRVEISKEEIPGSKRSMYGYMLTYSRL